MVKPAACSERNADSRPEPGPATSTSSVRMPCSIAFCAASSAATCAANGVDLREPLKPFVPADDQAMVLPCASVIVIMVLLNEALTCATPEAMFLRSRLRTRVASLPMLDPFAAAPPTRSRSPQFLWPACRRRRPVTSSFRQSAWPAPCGYGGWCECAGRAREGRDDAAGRDSSPGPSAA